MQKELKKALKGKENSDRILSFAAKFGKVEAGSSGSASVKWNWTPVPFSGKASNWGQLWDLFRTAIHENKNLDDSKKMKSLSDGLKRDARLAFGSMQLTGKNHDDAMKLLLQQNADPLILSKSCYDMLPPPISLFLRSL
ncbi:hypothetical protein U1Q18_045493 [Sarracenia purpurea var. burkii]